MEREVSACRRFVDFRLLPDLRHVVTYQGRLKEHISEYELLLEQIGLISKQVTEGNEKQMLLDMGDGVFGHAELTKPNKFYVDVGLKVFVEMSTTESLRFCYEKVYHLRKKVESLGDQEVEIRTHLDMVEFNLEELRRVL